MRAMIWAAALLLATGAATAEPAGVNLEELTLYPERYAGRTVELEGVVIMAERNYAFLALKPGKLKPFSLPFYWAERDKLWEYAQYECARMVEREECRAKVTGKLVKDENIADYYTIQNAIVEFLTAPK